MESIIVNIMHKQIKTTLSLHNCKAIKNKKPTRFIKNGMLLRNTELTTINRQSINIKHGDIIFNIYNGNVETNFYKQSKGHFTRVKLETPPFIEMLALKTKKIGTIAA